MIRGKEAVMSYGVPEKRYGRGRNQTVSNEHRKRCRMAERASMRKKIFTAALAVVLCLGTTGCGENTIPNLTEDELQLIGEYTAVTLMKYDANRRSRLVELPQEEEPAELPEEIPEAEELPQETEELSGMGEPENTPVIDRTDNTENGSVEAVLALPEGISVSYAGLEVCDVYPNAEEPGYFVLRATEGKKLLVLRFSLFNGSGQEQTADIASQPVEFRVTVNGDYTRNALPSLLPDDLTAFRDTLSAGETREAVLVIEVGEQSGEEIGTVSLKLKNDAKTYTIQLL